MAAAVEVERPGAVVRFEEAAHRQPLVIVVGEADGEVVEPDRVPDGAEPDLGKAALAGQAD